MKYSLILLFYFITSDGYSQKIIDYRFVVANPIYFDTINGAYINMELEFNSQRIYINDSTFKEVGLFRRDRDQEVFFKKGKGGWYYKVNNQRWKFFYSDSCKCIRSSNFVLAGDKYQIKWLGTELFNNYETFTFVFLPIGFTINHKPTYFFNSIEGVIGIKIGDLLLYRKDIGNH